MYTPTTTEPPRQHLHQLTVIRSILLVFFWCGFLASFWFEIVNLPRFEVGTILAVFSAIHLVTFLRLHLNRPIHSGEFFAQLIADVFCLNGLFYFSGGATNPFVSYLLVPVCISAATLPWRSTWFITTLCVAAYSLLLFFHISLPIFVMDHMQAQTQLNWHILGMWFNFFVSAVLITHFVVKMAQSLRQQENELNQMREDELRNEQVIAVATLAAGAAHEMNTPLATITLLLAELRDEHRKNPPLLADLTLLSQQIGLCSGSLKQLVQDATAATQGMQKHQNVKTYCNSIIDRWQLMRPGIYSSIHIADTIDDQIISYDSRLDHAIINLLNNAADASPGAVSVEIYIAQGELVWRIIDTGSGISDGISPLLGRQTFTTKKGGLGLGMLLSHTTINRYGGSLNQTANAPQGTISIIKLPL